MNKLTVRDLKLKRKRVFIRVDFNVPQDENGSVTDDTRIRAALPTIKYVIEKGGKVILAAHLGRPKGKVVDKLCLDPVAEKLAELLGRHVEKLNDCIGDAVEKTVAAMQEGDVVLLENVRFHKEETDNEENFSRALAKLADVYVNDAFGAAHRAHASTAGITRFVEKAAAGFLLEKEILFLTQVLEQPEHPFVAILGGAKVSDKIGVIRNLLDKVDRLLIGGGMAYTFLKGEGISVGKSILEEDKQELAHSLLVAAKEKKVAVLLPVDHRISDRYGADGEVKDTEDENIPEGWLGLDIGEKTIKEFSSALAGAKTIVWNGPLGVSEFEPFARGTKAVAETVSKLEATTVIGGGDTAAAIKQLGLSEKFTHISTGGGASLEFLEGKVLPGVAALTNAEEE